MSFRQTLCKNVPAVTVELVNMLVEKKSIGAEISNKNCCSLLLISAETVLKSQLGCLLWLLLEETSIWRVASSDRKEGLHRRNCGSAYSV